MGERCVDVLLDNIRISHLCALGFYDTTCEIEGLSKEMKCRSCGREVGTETCNDCYGNPFPERKRMKLAEIDPGMARILIIRTMQIMALTSIIVAYAIKIVGIPDNIWTVMIPFVVGFFYIVLDYKYILSQEQKFMFGKNPGFMELKGMIRELLDRDNQKADRDSASAD